MIGAAFTCCLYPLMTLEAMQSVADRCSEIVVVIDACRRVPEEEKDELRAYATRMGARVIENEARIGCGFSLDRARHALSTPLMLTVDHGVRLRGPLIEQYSEALEDGVVGVGMQRGGKACTAAFGPYVDPFFALWDRTFIEKHDLSFCLSHIRLWRRNWQVPGCSTAELLCYRAQALGAEVKMLGRGQVIRHLQHIRTPRGRGRCASPHHLVVAEESALVPLRRKVEVNWPYAGGAPREPVMFAATDEGEMREAFFNHPRPTLPAGTEVWPMPEEVEPSRGDVICAVLARSKDVVEGKLAHERRMIEYLS